MNLLRRLFHPGPDPRDRLQPLWFACVVEAREPRWYRDLGVADTVEGRFDMITLVLALVQLRLEPEGDQAENNVRLTELFIEDMDAQLRQSGVGDLVVGKHVGKLMATLGGRVGALRSALPVGASAVAEVIERNVSLIEGASPQPLADAVLALHAELGRNAAERLLQGHLDP